MSPYSLTAIGLVLDIIGCFLIWRYGLPADINRAGAMLLAAEETDENEKVLARKYDKRSTAGFAMLAIGFFCQLIGTLLSQSVCALPPASP